LGSIRSTRQPPASSQIPSGRREGMADGRNCGIPGGERPCITLSLCSGDEVTQAERLKGRTRLSDSGDGHMIAGADGLSIKDPRRRSWTHPGPWGVSLHGRPYAVSGLGHRRPDPEAALGDQQAEPFDPSREARRGWAGCVVERRGPQSKRPNRLDLSSITVAGGGYQRPALKPAKSYDKHWSLRQESPWGACRYGLPALQTQVCPNASQRIQWPLRASPASVASSLTSRRPPSPAWSRLPRPALPPRCELSARPPSR